MISRASSRLSAVWISSPNSPSGRSTTSTPCRRRCGAASRCATAHARWSITPARCADWANPRWRHRRRAKPSGCSSSCGRRAIPRRRPPSCSPWRAPFRPRSSPINRTRRRCRRRSARRQLLKPVAEAPQASVAARRAYVEVLTELGYEQQAQTGNEKDAVVTLQLAKDTAAQLGAPRPVEHGDGGPLCRGRHLAGPGVDRPRPQRRSARRRGAMRVPSPPRSWRPARITCRRCGRRKLRWAPWAPSRSWRCGRPMPSTRQERDLQDALTLVQLDPTNTISINNLGSGASGSRRCLLGGGAGRGVAALVSPGTRGLWGASPTARCSSRSTPSGATLQLAAREADDADLTHAEANWRPPRDIAVELKRSEAPDSSIPAMSQCLLDYGRAAVAMWRGDAASAREDHAGRWSMSCRSSNPRAVSRLSIRTSARSAR